MFSLNKKLYLYIAIIFFLILNWGSVYFSWQGRSLPPEPDDSGVFLTLIYAHSKFGNVFSPQIKIFNIPWQWDETGGIDKSNYFSWAFFWGNVSKLTPVNKELILQLSFYVGIVLFLYAIIYFFKKEKQHFQILIIVLMAFFTGDGLYHGLYWPTPSLYSVSLFLLILRLMIDGQKYWWLKIFFLLPIFLLIHPLSIVAIFSLAIFSLICLLIKRSNIIMGRNLIVFAISLVIYFLWIKFLNLKNVPLVTTNSNVLYFVISQLWEKKISILDISVKNVFDKYIFFLLTRPFFFSIFVLGLTNIYKKNKDILILYLSFIVLMLLGLLFVGGEKILLYAWVLTFFIMAYGLEHLLLFFKKQIKNFNNKIINPVFLLLINVSISLVWAIIAIHSGQIKDSILGKSFIFIFLIFLPIAAITRFLLAKKILRMLIIFSLMGFFSYLFLEKISMIIFLNRRMNFTFDKKLFLSKIDPQKQGLIIYNDNLSFAVFSGMGLLEREAVKKEFLKRDDLNKAAYFITRSSLEDCQNNLCFFKEGAMMKQMKMITKNNNFLIYEF